MRVHSAPTLTSVFSLISCLLERNLEGIVAKHRDGIYDTRRPAWVKIKNPKCTQAVGRVDLFEVTRMIAVVVCCGRLQQERDSGRNG